MNYLRLIYLRKVLNLTQDEFAAKLGFTRGAISAMENQRCEITSSNQRLICNIFHVNPLWAETGEGQIFSNVNEVEEEFFTIFKALNPTLQKFLIDTAKHLLDIQDELF